MDLINADQYFLRDLLLRQKHRPGFLPLYVSDRRKDCLYLFAEGGNETEMFYIHCLTLKMTYVIVRSTVTSLGIT